MTGMSCWMIPMMPVTAPVTTVTICWTIGTTTATIWLMNDMSCWMMGTSSAPICSATCTIMPMI